MKSWLGLPKYRVILFQLYKINQINLLETYRINYYTHY